MMRSRALVGLLLLAALGCSSGHSSAGGERTSSPPTAPRTTIAPRTTTTTGHGMTVRLVLTSTAVAGGGTLHGYVELDNETGQSVPIGGCGARYGVVLQSGPLPALNGRRIETQFAVPACLTTATVATGPTRYPVSIRMTYTCLDLTDPPECPPNDVEQPLPSGVYATQLRSGWNIEATRTDATKITVTTPPPG